MESYDAKITKWGIVFFGDPATIRFDATRLEIISKTGSTVFSTMFTNLKRANFNSNNGMWTFKSNDGQKCNLVVKSAVGAEKLGSYLDAARVGGLTV